LSAADGRETPANVRGLARRAEGISWRGSQIAARARNDSERGCAEPLYAGWEIHLRGSIVAARLPRDLIASAGTPATAVDANVFRIPKIRLKEPVVVAGTASAIRCRRRCAAKTGGSLSVDVRGAFIGSSETGGAFFSTRVSRIAHQSSRGGFRPPADFAYRVSRSRKLRGIRKDRAIANPPKTGRIRLSQLVSYFQNRSRNRRTRGAACPARDMANRSELTSRISREASCAKWNAATKRGTKLAIEEKSLQSTTSERMPRGRSADSASPLACLSPGRKVHAPVVSGNARAFSGPASFTIIQLPANFRVRDSHVARLLH